MVALWMAMFFVLAAAVAWLVLFPAARDDVLAGTDRMRERLAAVLGRWQSHAGRGADASGRWLHGGGTRIAGTLRRHRLVVAVALLVLLLPPLLILLSRREVLLVENPGIAAAPDAHVLALLRGERLAPPPELPPAMFTTVEADRVLPGIATADRKWHRLDDDFRQRLLTVFRVMRDQHGYEMALVEGYRSPERQARLAARGSSVTLAGAGRSWHQYGLAADSAPVRHGKLQWDMEDPWTRRGYHLYGEVARSVGLVWGGGWTSIQDYGHVELRRPGVRPPP